METTLIRMSLGGAILIAVTVLIRLVGLNRLPKRLFPALWCLALLRLLTPLSVPVPAGLAVPALPVPELKAVEPPDASVPENQGGYTGAAALSGAVPSVPAKAPSEDAEGSLPLVPAVWAAVGLGLGLYFAVSRARFCRELRTAVPVENEFASRWLASLRPRRRVRLRELAGLPSPLTYGIVRPVILVPRTFDWSDTDAAGYVLYHEYTHIRRLDSAQKLLTAAALCLHWFNPLVWVMYFLLDRDLELACDEAVLRHYGAGRRRDYAETIIGMEEKRALPTPFGSFFSKNTAEERIRAIMKFKKNSVIALALALVLALAGTVTVFAVADSGNKTPPPDGDEKSTPILPAQPIPPIPTTPTTLNDTNDTDDTDSTTGAEGTSGTIGEFTMDWALDHAKELSDRELIAFAARSDGAYAEGAGSELARRFAADPRGLLRALAEEEEINVDSAVYLLAVELYWDERGDTLQGAAALTLTGPERAVLEAIAEQYNKTEQNNR